LTETGQSGIIALALESEHISGAMAIFPKRYYFSSFKGNSYDWAPESLGNIMKYQENN